MCVIVKMLCVDKMQLFFMLRMVVQIVTAIDKTAKETCVLIIIIIDC